MAAAGRERKEIPEKFAKWDLARLERVVGLKPTDESPSWKEKITKMREGSKGYRSQFFDVEEVRGLTEDEKRKLIYNAAKNLFERFVDSDYEGEAQTLRSRLVLD